jgi:fructose/tagatose bisphosphate aldolase
MILATDDLYKIAYGKYAIGAYNIDNLEQMLGLFRGCIESQIPFTIQLSKGTRQYAEAMPATNLSKKMWPSPNGWSSGCAKGIQPGGRTGASGRGGGRRASREGSTFLTATQEAVEFVTETDCDSSPAGFQMLAGQ